MLIDDLNVIKYTENLQSVIQLKKPSGEIVGILENTYSENLNTDLIGINTFTFNYLMSEHYANDVKVGKFINLKIEQERKVRDGEGGYTTPSFYEEEFYISSIERSDGDKEYLKVEAKSIYILLGNRIIQGYSGIKKLYRTPVELIAFVPGLIEGGTTYETLEEYEDSGVLNYIMKLIPDWEIDTVNSVIAMTFREVDLQEDSVLDILTSFVPENYEGIVRFDTVNKKISVQSVDELGQDEGLIVESNQIAKKITTKTIDDEWITKLYVYGSDGITIAPVSPTGDDYILNLSYVTDPEFMSGDLIEAIGNYETGVEDSQASFSTQLTELNDLENELNSLIDTKYLKENELENLKIELDNTIIRYANSETQPTRTTALIVQDINDKKREIGNSFTEVFLIGDTSNEAVTLSETYLNNMEVYLVDNNFARLGIEDTDYTFNNVNVYDIDGTVYQKVILTYNANFGVDTIEQDISAKQVEVDDKVAEIVSLRNSLKIDSFFTDDLIKELQPYIREKVYRNDNITIREDLYEKGLEVIDKINSPQVDLTIDASDFLSSIEYSTQWDKMVLGNIITVKSILLANNSVQMRLVGYKWSFNDNKLALTLSSSNRQNEDTFELEELLNRANKTSTNISLNSSDYGAYVNSGERNSLLEYINNTLNLSAQGAVAGVNQEVSFENGILLSNSIDDGRKLKLLNNMLVLTSDGFETADVAITPDGVFAEKLIGEMIIGANLSIKTSDESSFVVNGDGVQISNSILNIIGDGTNGVTIDTDDGLIITDTGELRKTTLNATDGFKIDSRIINTDPWNTVLEAKTDGTLVAANLVIKDGKFTYGGHDLISTIGGTATIDFTYFDTIIPDQNLLKGIEIKNNSDQTTFRVDTDGNVTLGGALTWFEGTPPPELVGEDGAQGPVGPEGPQGDDGDDANLLDWVQDWDGEVTKIGSNYLATIDVLAGTVNSSGETVSGAYMSGVQQGLFFLNDADFSSGYVEVLSSGNLVWDGSNGAVGRIDYDYESNPEAGNAKHRLLIESASGTALKLLGGSDISLDANNGDIWCHNDVRAVDPQEIKNFKVYGAVFNDYAEYRPKEKDIEAGYVVTENNQGKLDLNNKKRNRNVYIVSDTFGMIIGDDSGLPIATSGRVLVYIEGKIKVGDEVVTTKKGTLRKAKFWEKFFYSVGHVSEIPDYEIWGTEKVEIKKRIWINLK